MAAVWLRVGAAVGLLSAMGLGPRVDAARLPPPLGGGEQADAAAAVDQVARAWGEGRYRIVAARHFRVARRDHAIPWQQVLKTVGAQPPMQGAARRLAWTNPRDELTAAWSLGGRRGLVMAAADDGRPDSFAVGYYDVEFAPGAKLEFADPGALS